MRMIFGRSAEINNTGNPPVKRAARIERKSFFMGYRIGQTGLGRPLNRVESRQSPIA